MSITLLSFTLTICGSYLPKFLKNGQYLFLNQGKFWSIHATVHVVGTGYIFAGVNA